MSERHEVIIEKLVYGGDGMARLSGQVIFVPFTAPGDHAVVTVEERKPDYLRGSLVELSEAGPGRTTPPCGYYGSCGGCQLQHLDYPVQVASKRAVLQETLQRALPGALLPEIEFVPSREFGYRRNVRFQVSRDSQAGMGFFQPRSNDIVEVTRCPLLVEGLNRAYQRFRQCRPLAGLANMRIGGIRGIYGREDGAAVFVILDKPPRHVEPRVLGCYRDDGEHMQRASPLRPPHVREAVCGLSFQLHPLGFFQSNIFLTEILVARILDLARAGPPAGGMAVELYCGNGLFTLPLAGLYRSVTAVEQDRQSLADGMANAAANDVGNIRWACDAVDRWIVVDGRQLRPEFVLVDPPREGLSKSVSRWVLEARPQRVAYVSCSPPTLVRDLRRWVADGAYRISSVLGLDLFPQTYHIETLVLLERCA